MTVQIQQKRRRTLALLAGMAAFAVVSQSALRSFGRRDTFEFVEMSDPNGFRLLRSGGQGGFADPFIGLDPVSTDFPKVEVTDIEPALFYQRRSTEHVQLAYFSDLYCPSCRVLERSIRALADEVPLDVSRHELPILTESSVPAAKGHIAAQRQGAEAQYHAALSATPVQVTYPFLERLAERLGMDVIRFETDFHSEQTLEDLGRSAALARIFGVIGTPSMIVGRTLVIGGMSQDRLRQLIALEA